MRMHLASLVDDFRAHTAETAVVSHRGVRRYASSYGQIAELAGRFAAYLQRLDIPAGERVVLWGENSAEWIAAFFGCLLRGVLAVPLDAAGSPEFAGRVLAEVSPRLVIGDGTLLATLATEVPKMAFTQMGAELPAQAEFTVDESVREDAPFQIIFTSGTTSEPKGIIHTHRNVLASLRPIESEIAKYRKYERWVHPLRFLHTLPLSHVFGQFMGLWTPGILTAELHFSDQLEPQRTIDLIGRERISVLIAVPRFLSLLRAHLLRRFPSLAASLQDAAELNALGRWFRFRAVHRALGWKFWAVISGGAALPAELEHFWNRLGYALIQGYGMTETAALVTLNHPFRIGEGTIGKVLPGREVRLSETGEILVRGDMVSTATWQHGRMQPRQGEWLATGDIAEKSDSGDFRFIGRQGDVIVTSAGLNIYPADVEAAMLAQPAVRACAVVPCEILGSIEPVCVVLFAGADEALQQTVRQANARLAEYQHIRRTLRWPEVEFPYTSTGKLLRRKIRDWACQALQNQSGSEPSRDDPLLALVAEVTGAAAVPGGDDRRLTEDLFLDSLGRVQLASEIEQRMGIEIGEEQIAGIATLGELRTALCQPLPSHRPSSPTPLPADAAETNLVPQPEPQATAEPHVYPHWPWTWPFQILRRAFLETIVLPLVALLLAPRVTAPNAAALPFSPCLIIANHVTSLDAALVLYALPMQQRRRVAIAMSGEMLLDFRASRGQGNAIANLFAPVAYWLVTALFNVFPLPSLRGFRRSFTHAGEALDHSYSVLIFPEGTRSYSKEMAAFRPGIGLLAMQARVPVLPVALVGMDSLLPGKRNWFRTGRLEIRIGEIITLPENTPPADWTAKLESAMRQLLA
jgi:long-chain acyl-CoA synthetase